LNQLVLVGVPGAGKTTIGKLLATEMGSEFFDSDEEVVAQTGSSVFSLFIEKGEPLFREIEREVIARGLERSSGVYALGGGAVLDPSTRELLKHKRVCWLGVSARVAAKRVGLDQPRPVLAGNVRAQMVKLLNEREPLYKEVATFTVVTDELSPSEVVREVMQVSS
jgi:shikimate kinase